MRTATMLRNLEHKLRTQTTFTRCRYKTIDGQIGTCSGLSILEPFLEGQIAELTIDDQDTARLLGVLDLEDKVKITVVPRGTLTDGR